MPRRAAARAAPTASAALRGWPFFAPSPPDAVAAALDLAELAPGDHLVDLGCGDGQVLVAAARRGAAVTGVESDPSLAQAARDALSDAGLAERAEVLVADLLDPAVWPGLLDRDPVLFAYLSPALLQRLTPVLREAGSGRRLVTVDFDLPDLRADRRRGPARLYRLPGRERIPGPRRVGWPAAGTLCAMPAEVHSLTTLEAVHGGGPVGLRLTGSLAGSAEAAVGATEAARGRPVAVDLRWHERAAGSLSHGEVCIAGLDPHPVVVLFTEEDQGQWDLSAGGCRELLARLRDPSLPPLTTTSELLAAAEGEGT